MATPVQMPKQGNTVEECLLVEWNVAEGDTVNAGDILCGIETDKATFEVEAPAAGTVLKLFRDAGDLVPVLTNIAALGDPGEDVSALAPSDDDDASSASATAAEETKDEAPAPSALPAAQAPATVAPSGEQRISPRAKTVASRLGVDASHLSGSGPHGRVVSADVEAAAQAGGRMTPLAAQVAGTTGLAAGAGTGVGGRVRAGDLTEPAVGAMPPIGEPTVVPYKGIRKLIGDRMLASLQDHAQLTLNASADATALLAFRKKVKDRGAELGLPDISMNDVILYVVARTLMRFPELNAVFDRPNAQVVRYPWVHLAFAVDTDRGLMVPVMQNASGLSLAQISETARSLAGQCRAGSIDPDLLQGGTFTITNLGALGVESFTPVLNSPQVAILGICSIVQQPVPDGAGGVRFQPTMGLSLTIDHQVVDGAPAARFLQAVAQGLGDLDLLLAAESV